MGAGLDLVTFEIQNTSATSVLYSVSSVRVRHQCPLHSVLSQGVVSSGPVSSAQCPPSQCRHPRPLLGRI